MKVKSHGGIGAQYWRADERRISNLRHIRIGFAGQINLLVDTIGTDS
jgi:hypothetical protein